VIEFRIETAGVGAASSAALAATARSPRLLSRDCRAAFSTIEQWMSQRAREEGLEASSRTLALPGEDHAPGEAAIVWSDDYLGMAVRTKLSGRGPIGATSRRRGN
jgi:hypothetical protein